MDSLVKELKEIMDEKHLSIEATSRHIDCSYWTLIRWLNEERNPRLKSQRLIRDGIDRIKKAFPEKESTYELALKGRSLWRKIINEMTRKEKVELFEINAEKGQKAYNKRLQELVEKYGK